MKNHQERLETLDEMILGSSYGDEYLSALIEGSDEGSEEHRRLCLLELLRESDRTLLSDDVISDQYDETRFSVGSAEYLVLTDEGADEAWEESLDNYLGECVYPELSGNLAAYFDEAAWKRDARFDGRGHCLSSYDGSEETARGYCVFRIN